MARRLKIDLPISYQQCRTFGHAWDPFIPFDKRPAPWGRRFSLRCDRCGMERHDVIDGLGRISTRHYDQPPNYSTTADDRPNIEALRLSVGQYLADEMEPQVTRVDSIRKKPAAKKAPARRKSGRLHAVS